RYRLSARLEASRVGRPSIGENPMTERPDDFDRSVRRSVVMPRASSNSWLSLLSASKGAIARVGGCATSTTGPGESLLACWPALHQRPVATSSASAADPAIQRRG